MCHRTSCNTDKNSQEGCFDSEAVLVFNALYGNTWETHHT